MNEIEKKRKEFEKEFITRTNSFLEQLSVPSKDIDLVLKKELINDFFGKQLFKKNTLSN